MPKSLLSNKEKLLELANTPLNENCSAVILKKLLEKLGDSSSTFGFDLVDYLLDIDFDFLTFHALFIPVNEEQTAKICTPYWKPPIFYDDDDDDDEESSIPLKDIISELPLSIAITPDFPITDSLIIEDEHLDTIPETESDEENESSVEDLNLTPSESEDLSDIENTSIVSSPKFDSLLEEFSGELAHIDLISPKIDEAEFDPEEEIRLVEKLLYDNSSPRPPEELNSKNSDAVIESFTPSPIPIEDSESLMEEIDIFLAPDDLIPPSIENDDYDLEGDILFLEEFLSNDSLFLPENESFHFDRYYDLSSPRPPAKPTDDDGIYFDVEPDTEILTVKMVDDISERYVLMPSILPTIPPVVQIAPDFEDSRARVDFLNSTHIKYALTENPTIYVSLIHQFWQTASASTSENGEMEITATIDGRVKTVTEASIRRHLKLEDSNGISTLPNTKIFEQLALMRVKDWYRIFTKGQKQSQNGQNQARN
ncbi:hypothetical protein Tco_0859341 [Tanacetum coccineum]|uniref:Reverse transcriptase domain-containing protein n=1 Tax=Tanacetum coccineum TaxID=301880 RepID=A0ABQ5BFM9_9ASTR